MVLVQSQKVRFRLLGPSIDVQKAPDSSDLSIVLYLKHYKSTSEPNRCSLFGGEECSKPAPSGGWGHP